MRRSSPCPVASRSAGGAVQRASGRDRHVRGVSRRRHRHSQTSQNVVWRAGTILLLAIVAMGHAGHAHAQQTLYWSGTAGTATPSWNTPLAWSTGSASWVPPAAIPGAGDTAVFGIASLSGQQLVQISGTQSVFGLVFSSTSPTALSGTNGSSAITIGAGGITVTPSADFYVFGLDGPSTSVTVALSGSTGQRWNNQSSNVPNLHGPFARGRGATLTMLGNAPFALRSATNTFGMLGPWATYEGGSAVGYLTVGAGGTMTAFTGATSAATAAAVTDTTGTMNYDVAGPGALGPNASFNTLRYTGGAGTISGSFSANGLMNAGDPGTGTLAFSGRITAGATGELVVAAGRVIDLQGTIADGGGPSTLVKTGTGTLILSGNNSYTGGTVVNDGTVMMFRPYALGSGTSSLAVSSGTLSIGGYSVPVSSLTGGPGGTIAGSGTLTVFAAANSTYAGGFASGGMPSSPTLVKSGSGALTLSGSNSLAGIAINGGRLVASHANALGGGTTAITVNAGTLDIGTVSPVIGALSGSAGAIITTSATAGVRTLTTSIASGSPVYAGSIQDNGAGTIGLTTYGAAALTLSGSNSFTGPTRLVAGGVTIANRDALAGTTLDLQAGDTGSLSYNVYSGTMNIGGLTGSRTITFPSYATIAIGGNGQSTTFSGTLSGSGAFVKQGAGTLTLTGSAAIFTPFTGLVRIAGGTLALGSPGALAGATVEMNPADAGTLAFSGTAPQTYYLAALTGTRNVNIGGNTLAIGSGNPTTSSYDGTLSGSGGLIKVGSGTLALTNTNAYTGTTRIQAGVLQITNRDALAGTTLDLQAGDTGSLAISVFSGTLNIGGLTGSRSFDVSSNRTTAIGGNGQSTTYAGTLSGSGPFVKQGAGTLTLTGSTSMLSPYTGTVRIAGGTLALGNPAALAAATVDMNYDDAGTLAFSGTAPQTFALAALTGWRGVNLGGNTLAIGTWTSSTSTYDGTLSGSGGLIKVGSSTLVLTNSNAYTGTTRIESGTLRIDNRVALAGSTLDLQASDTGTLWINVFSGTVTIGGLAGSRSFDVSSTRTNAIGGNGQSTTYSGTLSGTGVLVKQGAGTLTLTGSTSMLNPYTGTVRIAGGTLALGNPAALAAATVDMNYDDAGTLAFSGTAPQTFALAALTGWRGVNLGGNTLAIGTWTSSTSTYYGTLSGSGGLIKFGNSTLALAGSNAYTGTTRIEAGTLRIDNRDALAGTTLDLQAGDTGSLWINVFSGTVNIGGLAGSRPVSIPSFVTVAVGGNGQSTTYSGTIQNSGAFVKQGAGTLTLTATAALSGGTVTVNEGRLVGSAASLGGTIFNNATLEFAQATSGTFGGLVFSSTNTGVQTVKSGAGTLALTGTILGNVTVSGGRLVTQAANIGGQLVADGTVEFAQATSGTFTGTLAGSGGLVKTGGGTLALQGGTFNGTTTVSGGRLVASAATLRGPIVANATMEFAQAINGEHVAVISGSGTVVKSGAGTLLLSGANLFTGTTSVTEGILATAAADRLADASTVSLAPGGSLRLGGDETIATLLGSGSVNLQTFQLTIAGGGTFAGGLFGSGGLTKAGPGSLALSGSSGFLGATRLNAGTLVLSSPSALSSFTTLSIASGATLVLDTDVRVFAFTNAGTITGAGQLLTSATTATSGTLTALSDASGPDGYSVGLLKTSTDTLVVSGSTSFTGGVVVEQGTVQLAAGGAFAPTNVVEVQSGATLDLNGQSQTVAALSGGGGVALGGGTLTVASTTDTVFDGAITGGSLVKAGASVLDLTGSSTVSTATVTEGVLSVNGTLTGDVAVAPAGVLGGAGTIIGDVAVSGTHAPGNSPDISTITGDLSYVMGSTVIWELAANTDAQGPLAARTHDQVVVGQNLAFTGSTSLVLSFFDQDPNSSWISTVDWTDPFWDEDRTWTLWDVAGTTTGFGNLSIAPGAWLDANGTPIDSIRPDAVFLVQRSGSDVLLVYSVPEPGTLALAAGGFACAALGAWRRRTRRRGNRGWVGVEPRSISSFLAITLMVACAGTVRAQAVSVTDGAVQSNESPASYSFLSVSGTSPVGSPSTYSANAALTLTDSFFVHSAGVLNANADINVTNYASLSDGGRLNLNAGVLTANYLNVSGTIVRGGGTYNARGLGITRATVEYATGDSVAEQIFVNSGGRLVLSRNLSLTGAFQVDKGEVLRSTATIAASHINLFGATLDLRAGDTVNTTNPNVMSTVSNTGTTSATLNVTGSMTFGKLSVQEGSTLNANAPMQARLVVLRTNATANINANVAVPNDGVWIESGAKINLSSGTLSSYQLRATGTGAITRTGGSYAVTSLFLEGGAATTYSAGDSIGGVSLYQGGVLTLNRDLATSLWLSGSNSVLVRNGHSIAVSSLSMSDGAVFTTLASDSAGDARISGTGTVLTASSPLTVSYLDVWNGATLRLESFTGSWSGSGGFALAVQGDVRERLDGYVSSGRIQASNNPGPIMVTYDDAVIRTYVVSATGSQVVSGSTTIFGTVTGSTSVSSGGAATFAGQVTGTVTVAPGGQATFAGGLAGTATITGSATVQGVVSGAVSASNGGNVVITGSVAPTAQVSVGAGSTVSIGNGAAVAQPTLANAGKFAVANTGGTVVVPTAITGTGSFEKTGAGSVQLTGSSNFTGGSTIASGEVVVQNAKALGSGGVTVSSGGKLLVDGVALNLGGAAVSLVTGAELRTTSGARVTVSGSSDLSGVRSTSPAATTAAILAGTAVSGTLATTWTTSANSAVKSEVLELKTPTSAANPFVLSLQYASGLDPAGLFLGWNDPVSGDWVNAVVGNELLSGMTAATGGQLGYLGSFSAFQGFYGTNLSSYLGAYGRDDSSRTVWAVINHNSEFAITAVSPVPEPTTWALAALGLAGVALRPHRRRRPDDRRKGSAPTRVNGMPCRPNTRWSWGSGRGARMANLRAFAGCLAVGLVAMLSGRASATPQVFLPVGNPGNVAKTGSNAGVGSVPYEFSMRSTEATVNDYTAFLNAAAKADPNSLYITNMTNIGITRTGSSGRFVYSASPSFQNRPVTFVTWNSAARYVNWLTTGSTTETGSYDMAAPGSGITTRLPTARFVLPSRDEWFKAAFFVPSAPTGTNGTWSLWAATAGSGTTTPSASGPPGGVGPAANRNLSASGTTSNVGAYTTTFSAYGMYDMLGNVTEWSDTPVAGTSVNVFSGAYTISDPAVWNSNAAFQTRTFSTFNANVGFRVVEITPVPEPATITLAALGVVGLCGANWMRRRRRPAAATGPALVT